MPEATNPLVSVVTPVYNGETFLEECIESVLNQSYANWEYILVNNSSTDRTPVIIDDYARRDDRIKVHHTDALLPIMKNWNFSLQLISPDSVYCKVVHADDWLFPECVERMVAVAEMNPTVGLVGSYSLWGDRVVSDRIPYPSSFLTGQEIARLTLLDKVYPFWSPSSLLIRCAAIREQKPYYDETQGRLHADVEACYEVLQHHDFGFVHQVLSFIRTHDESVTAINAQPFNTYILTNLDLLMKYGQIYLSDEDFRSHRAYKMKDYYRFLAISVFEIRDGAFWGFHRKTLAEMGIPLRPIMLIGVVLEEFIRTPVSKTKALFLAVWRILRNWGHSSKIQPV